jgi:DNA-binding transcriptional MocR family regulator
METEEFVRRIGDWNGAGAGTLGQRLALAIAGAVDAGLLIEGDRLPPERQLAEVLHVSRPTVQAALVELRDRGVLAARQGSGTWVARSAEVATAELAELALGGRGINLAASVPADALQLGDVELSVGDLLAAMPTHGYAPLGLASLRATVVGWLAERGVRGDVDGVLISHGGHGALVDVLGALIGPGDAVLAEPYTYPGLLDIVSALGGAVIAMTNDEHGPRPDELRRLVASRRPAAIVVSPECNNPTGRAWGVDRRAELIDVLAEAEVPVIDDAVLADLGAQTLPVLAADLDAITIGSLSKAVWGGLRIGWVALPKGKARQRVIRRRRHLDLGPSVPSQLLADELLSRLDTQLPARRSLIGSRADYVRERLAAELPSWSVGDRDGGLSLWVDLGLADAEAFVAVASAFGVEVFPGSRCRPDGAADGHVRIGIDRPTPQLDQGITRLVRAWATLRRS